MNTAGMQNYKPGTAVAVTFRLLDEAGEVLEPTALRWRVLDEAEEVLLDWASIAVPNPMEDQLTLTVSGALNLLTPPALRGLRSVELEVSTAAGVVELTQMFLLQGATAMAFGVNTFQTYAQAQLLAQDFGGTTIEGWSMVRARDEHEAALIEAHRRILLLPIGWHEDDTQSRMEVDGEFIGHRGPIMLRDLSPEHLAQLYPPMLADLRRAQLVEASEILGQDPVEAARERGLLSTTVGESSQFFRPATPLKLPVSAKAMRHIERWVRFGARIGRS